MARGTSKGSSDKQVETLKHQDQRRNIPTAEHQSLAERQEELSPSAPARYARARPLAEGETRERDADLDPQIVWKGARIKLSREQVRALVEKNEVEIGDAQLVWKGKDRQDWSDLVVPTPPIYVQEKIHPKAIIDDLKRRTRETRDDQAAPDLFADFNGLDDPEARTEFYQHDQHWSNRMILGDSLSVMASLAEREGLRGKVQCIYFDPPYGIKFNSNWQVSTLSRDVKDGKATDVSREPEQIKAFRDTWKDGIHSYLTYLRDRLTVARELLTESGSIFVQIGDENVHRVRAVMDEVFGVDNHVSQIAFKTTTGRASNLLADANNYLLWYARSLGTVKYRPLFKDKSEGQSTDQVYSLVRDAYGSARRLKEDEKGDILSATGARIFRSDNLVSSRPAGSGDVREFEFRGSKFKPGNGTFKTEKSGLQRLVQADRIWPTSSGTIQYIRYLDDFSVIPYSNSWTDTATGSFTEEKIYVVQTALKVIQRCVLMTTDPGDLVLDPTCGSGSSARISEQWGRRWITIDTSRVALALARTRLMSARFPFYLLTDSRDGRRKEHEITGTVQPDSATDNDVRQGFVYERVPHIMLSDIANNEEIETIYNKWQTTLEPLRSTLNAALKRSYRDWEIPREPEDPWPVAAASAHAVARLASEDPTKKQIDALIAVNTTLKRHYDFATLPERAADRWTNEDAIAAHAAWWEGRIARQKEIDASIARRADVEMLYDRPYEDRAKVRVAGPFTVESLSPHRVVPPDEEELIDLIEPSTKTRRLQRAIPPQDFAALVLENLRVSGVQQGEKRDRIAFTSLTPWPGEYVAAQGLFLEGETERKAAILIGPEFGTLTRVDLAAAAREAMDARFDALIACAFAFDAHASDMTKLGPLPILKAKMNPDLHMAADLKTAPKANLFIVFGEPDIEIKHESDGRIRVEVKGVDVYDPSTGKIRSNDVDGIAAWFIDDDYNEEGFFVRHAYFLGANDPYKSLKAALRAEIDEDAWATLYRAESRPFGRPKTGKIAVKVINHFGDEVMKVFRV